MQQPRGVGRRRLVTSALAGGALGAGSSGSALAKAATGPGSVPAKKLRPGDVVVGPGASVVRVASVDKLPGGRRRVRYTDPYTGAATGFPDDLDRTGFPARFRFVRLGTGASVRSVQLTRPEPATETPADGPTVIDGGAP